MAKRIKNRERDLEKTKTYRKENLNRKKKEKSENLWIAWFVICVFILALCALKLGFLITLVTAFVMLIISGLAYLIESTKGNSKKRKVLNIFLILFLILFIVGLLLFGVFLIYITIKAPKFDVDNLNTKEISIIYDKDGKEITRLGDEKREKVSYDQLPEVLVDAIVSTEDSRFFEHNGFDAPRFAKAAVGQLMGRSNAGGASTLSMQVVKNSFTSTTSRGVEGIIRKFTDIYLAVFKLEKKYSKEEIIEFYVNNHALGGMIYGVEEASKAYFNKDVSDLNLSEAAIIAGMFKSPNNYRPTVYPENAAARRKTVLYLMRRHGYITKEEEREANNVPVESLTKGATGGTSREGGEYQDYIDTVVEEMQDKYDINPKETSVKIYTNLDRAKQQVVNDVESGKTYKWKDDKVQTGVTVLDSATGKVLAIGAGRNRNAGDSIYATQAYRQIGSTAKPLFDYGPGIEYNHWSTYGYEENDDGVYHLFDDAPYQYSDGTPISNWDNGYYGSLTLRKALSASRNIPALKAFQKVDNNKIKEFVTSLGITPEICFSSNGNTYSYNKEKDLCVNDDNEKDTKKPSKIHEAHAIGAFNPGATPLQMAGAYAAFSNGGYYNEPYTVDHFVYRQTGETVKHKSDRKKVMSDSTAYMIASVLQDVQLTGGSIQNVAAKTGTTNFDDVTMKNRGLPADAVRDSWVVGFTTKTVISMWYGYAERETSQYVLRNIPATIAKDKEFKALAAAFESNKEEFKMPDSVVRLNIIAGSNPAYQAPDGYTGAVTSELFLKDHMPNVSNSGSSDTKLEKVTNLKGTYSNEKVTLTWTGVNAQSSAYGKIVYNVYRGNTLLKIVDGTTYTDENPGTGTIKYKVVATYESYSALASDGAETSVDAKEDTKQISYTVRYVCDGTTIKTVTRTASVKGNEKAPVSASSLLPNGITSTTCDTSASNAILSANSAGNGDTITITLKKNESTDSGTSGTTPVPAQ